MGSGSTRSDGNSEAELVGPGPVRRHPPTLQQTCLGRQESSRADGCDPTAPGRRRCNPPDEVLVLAGVFDPFAAGDHQGVDPVCGIIRDVVDGRELYGAQSQAAFGPHRLTSGGGELHLVAAAAAAAVSAAAVSAAAASAAAVGARSPEHLGDLRRSHEGLVRADHVEGLDARERGYHDLALPHQMSVNYSLCGVNDTYPTFSDMTSAGTGRRVSLVLVLVILIHGCLLRAVLLLGVLLGPGRLGC